MHTVENLKSVAMIGTKSSFCKILITTRVSESHFFLLNHLKELMLQIHWKLINSS